MAKAVTGKLVLGKHRSGPQLRTGRRSDWTQKMSAQFCETLADTCNVTLAAAAIERSIGNVYKWKGKDASFRTAWDRALAVGYSRLELMLLERVLHGVEKVVVARDGTSSVMREYPDRVALTLLRMHRDNAGLADAAHEGGDHDVLCNKIMAKLTRLKAREDSGTKAAKGVAKWIATLGARRRQEAGSR